MAFRQIFKVSRKTFFHPSAWVDLDGIKRDNNILLSILRGLFTTPRATHQETFEQAMKRLGLTETDIKNAQRTYYIFAYAFLALGIITFIFSFYLLFVHRTFSGWLIGIAVSALFFSQAFRYHFWYFQIKVRKLGCSYEEWKEGKVLHKGGPS